MTTLRHSLIAREGWGILTVACLLAFFINTLHHFAFIIWLIPLVLFWFYRDPVRLISSEPLGILSPVDGEIVLSEKHPDPYLGRDAFLIRICMRLVDIYSIRSIIEGKIIQQWLVPEEDDADERSLAHAIQVQTDEGDDIVMVLRPGRFFKKLSCDAVIGQRIGQGHRCGFIPLGACIDIYIPEFCQLQVENNQHVSSGQTVLATLKHHV